MTKAWITALAAAFLAALPGCSGSGENGGAGAGAAVEEAVNAPADYLGAVNQAQKTAQKVVGQTGLRQALDLFQAQEGRWPKSLDELVSKKYLKELPEAPRGMRLTYDPATGEAGMERL